MYEQRGLYLYISIYIPQCTWCAETIHNMFHVYTWVIPPYFLKAAFAKIFIRKIFRLEV